MYGKYTIIRARLERVLNMLKKLKFTQFSTNELSPQGWLRQQLVIQANGLSGNLDKIWPDVQSSKWIGGDKEGWERVPYWLDGFIPLAYLLDDEDMKARAKRYIDAILAGQKEDGWICPCEADERSRYDMWALFLICKVLVVYHDCTGDERIEEVLYKALKNFDIHLERHTLFGWASARWYECLIPAFWLYERRPEAWLKDMCHKLEELGCNYENTYEYWRYGEPLEHGRWSFMTHVVNTAMMLKSRALFSRLTGEDANAFAKKAIRILLRDHGMAVEHFTGDECLSGTSPIQGSELCSVTEVMYSYAWLASITGDSEWSDRLEWAAYNALPATISPDMWTHQYDQMTNQVECSKLHEPPHFRTNGGESHLFGLEPNFGCCTANFNQGWPKFALSTLMRAEDGIAITAIAPCSLKTAINGVDVKITIETEYPFEDGYKVIVEPAQPVEFTLYLRIPGNAKASNVSDTAINRLWQKQTEVDVRFTFETEIRKRPNGMVCVWRGPLLYALPIEEDWRKIEYVRHGVERTYPYCDYEIFPQSKWNYAICEDSSFGWRRNGVGEMPFEPTKPPVELSVKLVEIDWAFANGVCAEKPEDLTPRSEPQEMKLIPYGCTNLRMTEMPLL